MNLVDWLRKTYQKIILMKKLVWFAVNFFTMITPFKQIKLIIRKIQIKVQQMEKTIQKLAESNLPFSYLFQVYKQASVILFLTVILSIYAYFKFFKRRNQPNKQIHEVSKISRQLDELSQKTILPQTRMIREENEEVDSCCKELHNGLNTKQTTHDRVFLAILQRYQNIGFENEEDECENDREVSKNNQKYTQDNSTEEGNFKTSLHRIPTSPTNKKQSDLNRSSVL